MRSLSWLLVIICMIGTCAVLLRTRLRHPHVPVNHYIPGRKVTIAGV